MAAVGSLSYYVVCYLCSRYCAASRGDEWMTGLVSGSAHCTQLVRGGAKRSSTFVVAFVSVAVRQAAQQAVNLNQAGEGCCGIESGWGGQIIATHVSHLAVFWSGYAIQPGRHNQLTERGVCGGTLGFPLC
jgi:hypothetical protein